MSLADALIARQHVFAQCRDRVRSRLTRHGPFTLDDLAIATRFPSRTVLLVVADMLRRSELAVEDGRVRLRAEPSMGGRRLPATRPELSAERRDPSQVLASYATELARLRPDPALLWTQRWLTVESAVHRARTVAVGDPAAHPVVLLLGDDDAVSPLIAYLIPDANLVVIDIDQAVLSMLEELARGLRVRITTIHHDLSEGAPPLGRIRPTSVVCDPFPTADGSFEAAFWTVAAALLPEHGSLFTTTQPSHKPLGYSWRAQQRLEELGFVITGAEAVASAYELFDFELTAYERDLVAGSGLMMYVSHTKSLLHAIKVREFRPPADQTDALAVSPLNMGDHYLTQQVGLNTQREIVRTRGPRPKAPAAVPALASSASVRLDPYVIFRPPGPAAAASPGDQSLSALSWQRYEYELAADEEELLTALADGVDLASLDLEEQRLALCVRAIQSWTRPT